MSADGKFPGPYIKKRDRSTLDEFLDFGPDSQETSSRESLDVTARLTRIIKQIQELSQRIDDLVGKL